MAEQGTRAVSPLRIHGVAARGVCLSGDRWVGVKQVGRKVLLVP